MMETIKGLSFVEGFLTAMAAVMQDKEWTDNKVGRITVEADNAIRKLRNAEAYIKGSEVEIKDLREDVESLKSLAQIEDIPGR